MDDKKSGWVMLAEDLEEEWKKKETKKEEPKPRISDEEIEELLIKVMSDPNSKFRKELWKALEEEGIV